MYETWKQDGILNAMKSFKKQYGKMYTLWFGPLPTIHITDYELAKDQMVKHGSEYTLRFVPEIQEVPRKGLGIILNDGPVWQEHRRFALQTLRNFGVGKNVMEEKIMSEYNYQIGLALQKSENGKCILDPMRFFDILIGNIINQLLFGERFTEDNADFWYLKKLLDEALEFTFIDTAIPYWLMTTPLLKWRTDKLQAPEFKFLEFMKEKSMKRYEEVKRGERVLSEDATDFADAYFYKMEQDKKNGIESSFDFDNLATDLEDLWSAGQETSALTLTWGVLLLLNRPEYIDKIYEELLSVTEGDRQLSLTDKPNTPIFNATVNEVHRIASILNFNVFRKTEKDKVIDGYRIPAGTPITAEISVIMADDEIFPEFDKFDPARFLNDEKKVAHVVPFGMGKRACLGEALARSELYLILGNLLLEHDLKPNGRVPEQKTMSESTFFNKPQRFECYFVSRK